jgi:voltage-gated potassium channel
MTVTTVASVGYGEVHPLSPGGRVFTMVLIAVGLGAVLYGLSAVTAFWVEGDLSNFWERRKMSRRIAALTDHLIVCGGGDTGRHIARELLATETPFVVIEIDRAQEPALRRVAPEILYLVADATDADVLRQAGIARARALIACMPSDKDNLFTILTARELRPDLRVVSRLVEESSRSKLLHAGADAVVSNKGIGAQRLVSEILRPHAVDVLDAMVRESAVRVEEIHVGAAAAGRALSSLHLDDRAGIVVFALRDGATQRYEFNPRADRVLAAGDVLIACADPGQLRAARQIVTEA